MNKQNRVVIINLLLICLTIGIVYYLFNNKKPQSNEIYNSPPPEVKVITLKKSNVKLLYEYPAIIAGYREANVRSQASGVLQKKLYIEGEAVNAGDILFTIDDKPYIANLKKAKAGLVTAKVNFRDAEQNLNRASKLYAANAISKQERDSKNAIYLAAKEGVLQAESDLKIAELNLEYTNIKAPISGITSKEVLSEGNLINIGDLITNIVQKNKLYVNFAYPENDFKEIEKLIARKNLTINSGDKLTAKLKLEGDLQITGVIDFTDNNIDSETASISSRLSVENANLIPGQFVRIIIDNLIYKDAITIPEKSIIRTPGGSIVYLVEKDNKISIRPVKLDALTSEGYIVTSGLNEGDVIVYEGIMKAKLGQQVNPITNTK